MKKNDTQRGRNTVMLIERTPIEYFVMKFGTKKVGNTFQTINVAITYYQ